MYWMATCISRAIAAFNISFNFSDAIRLPPPTGACSTQVSLGTAQLAYEASNGLNALKAFREVEWLTGCKQ
jgi:hypothetical protein